jgi:hypothetical protein
LIRKDVRKYTYKAGAELYKEIQLKNNIELRQFLEKYKYVLIDRKGRVTGTNSGRKFGFGRIRLETEKVLNGKYAEMFPQKEK